MYKLLFNRALAHQWQCLRLDLVLNHVPNQLIRHLFEYLLGQLSEVLLIEVFEFNELDYVSLCGLVSRVPHNLVVAIKLYHIREI